MSMVLLLSLLGAGAAWASAGQGDGAPDDDAPRDDARQPDRTDTPAGTARTAPNFSAGTAGPDTLTADGTDILRARGGADTITASDRSTVYGDTGRDTITLSDFATGYGGIGADTLNADDDSTAFGGNGNDRIQASGNAVASGDGGNDLILWNPTDRAGHDTRLNGGAGDDTLRAASQTDGEVTLLGGIGRDLLIAGDGALARGSFGADTLVGGNGATLTGGKGADRFIASANQALSDTDDAITITDFAKGTDTIAVHLIEPPTQLRLSESGGDTRLTLEWQAPDNSPETSTVVIKGVTGLTLDDFDFVTEAREDVSNPNAMGFVTSAPLDNVLIGTAGPDRLTAPNGTTLLVAGDGNDSVTAGRGVTDGVISLGSGNDTFTGSGAFDLTGGDGDDSITYTPGPDPTARTDSFFTFDTGAGNDTVRIEAGAAEPGTAQDQLQINLGIGNDTLSVDKDVARNIAVFGNEGDDTISIWMGQSAIMFGGGADRLTIGIDADHIDTRATAQVLELTTADRVTIEIESGITGAVEFVQVPGDGEGDPVTVVQVGGKPIVSFNALIAANDPRITITRDAVFA